MKSTTLAVTGFAALAISAGGVAVALGADGAPSSRPRPAATAHVPTSSRLPNAERQPGAPARTSPYTPATPEVTGTPDALAPAPTRTEPQGTIPVRLQVPSIGVDTALQALGITSTGELQPPSEWQRAGWYAGGVRPGDVGPAVVAGHVDSVNGPAVFYRLPRLRSGAQVIITRRDGTQLRFVVDGTARYAKDRFPTRAVYGPTSTPVLRLVTCTGHFDVSRRSYVDNLVVTAHLVTT